MTADARPEQLLADLFRLDDRVAVVIGAGGGLGEAIVRGFREAGAVVIVADRDLSAAQRVADSCRSDNAIAVSVDITRSESIDALRTEVERRFDAVDVLVNSAGISARHPAEDFPEDDWDRVLEVNLKGSFLTCQAFGRGMLARRRGTIVNLASIAGRAGIPGTTAYSQSKGGIVQLTRSLAVEWIDRGVRVNAIAPSVFDTPLLHAADAVSSSGTQWMLARTPLGRFGRPDEIVGPALFLASDASSMVTGHVLAVDGGYLAA
jgi:NAD(P)-dependent dehydrogenase (short-subunit alcohol dehydrogenase family)